MLPHTQEEASTIPQHLSGTRAGLFYLLRQSAEAAAEPVQPAPAVQPVQNVAPFPKQRIAAVKSADVQSAFLEDTFIFDV